MRSEPRPRTRFPRHRLARSLALAAGIWLGAAGAPAAARPLDELLAEVDAQTIAASDVAIARVLGVLGQVAAPGPVTRDDVARMADAALLVAEARRLDLAPDAETLEAAWAEAATRAGGAALLEAWLDAHRVPRSWARALVEQDILRQRFIEERFRTFVFIGEAEIDAALGGPGGDREAARRRLTEAEVARELDEWLVAARARARLRILLPGGGHAPLVLPMPGQPPPAR